MIRPFTFNQVDFIRLPFPHSLSVQQATQFEVDRQGLNIKIMSLEGTLVNVLDRPNHSVSWEEIWKTSDHIPVLNLDKVIEYANLLNNATTIAELVFFLEYFKQPFYVDEGCLKTLGTKKPNGLHYLERSKRKPGKLLTSAFSGYY